MSATNITLRGDFLKQLSTLAGGGALSVALTRVMDEQNQLTVANIQERYLSFPQQEPATADGLRTVSNHLRGSISAVTATATGDGVSAGISSDAPYAAIQEFGGTFTVPDIVARNAKTLRFLDSDGNVIFRKAVKSHIVIVPARAPIQRGIADRLDDYTAAFEAAVTNLLNSKS